MSEENKESTQLTIPTGSDFTFKDLEMIEKFKEKGLVGLASVSDLDVEKSMALYLDGKSYRQIASILHIAKPTILYLSWKFKWWELRQQYLEELANTMPQKVIESKLQSQEFFLHLIIAYQRKIGSCVDKYLKTNDSKWTDSIDVKDINTYLKIVELMHKLDNQSLKDPNDKSLVGLNGLGEGVEIKRTGQNSVEITPKAPSPFASKLKQFAELKRQQEKESQAPKQSNDIEINQTGDVHDRKETQTKEDKNE